MLINYVSRKLIYYKLKQLNVVLLIELQIVRKSLMLYQLCLNYSLYILYKKYFNCCYAVQVFLFSWYKLLKVETNFSVMYY